MPLDGDARPLSKDAQLARAGKRSGRQFAGERRWRQIREAKQGPCRACGAAPPNTMAHLISRGQGGADTEVNIIPLCGSGTTGCHGRMEARDPVVGRLIAESLTDAEYAYVVEHYGEAFFERRLGVVYERA